VGSAARADVCLNAGYDLVVVDFIFPRAHHAERFQAGLLSNVSVSLFTLWAPPDIDTAREAARGDREPLGTKS
jgi:hypothetical protein